MKRFLGFAVLASVISVSASYASDPAASDSTSSTGAAKCATRLIREELNRYARKEMNLAITSLKTRVKLSGFFHGDTYRDVKATVLVDGRTNHKTFPAVIGKYEITLSRNEVKASDSSELSPVYECALVSGMPKMDRELGYMPATDAERARDLVLFGSVPREPFVDQRSIVKKISDRIVMPQFYFSPYAN